MDGLIILNKPTGITSAKALYRVRAITHQRKSGHAGTLDPAASGVLILCLGKATRFVESIMNQPKVYRATARLDVTSESFDSDRPLIPCPVASQATIEQVRDAIALIERSVEQIPPRISALKIGGVPSYKRSARGDDLQLAPRSVKIYWLRLHAYDWPNVDFEMCCGRGTYVRAVIRDVGTALGTGGCLTSLVRTCVGPFVLTEAWSVDQLATAKPSDFLLPLERARELLLPEHIAIPTPPAV